MAQVIADFEASELVKERRALGIGEPRRDLGEPVLEIVLMGLLGQPQGGVEGVEADPAVATVEVRPLEGDRALQRRHRSWVHPLAVEGGATAWAQRLSLLPIVPVESLREARETGAEERASGLEEELTELPQAHALGALDSRAQSLEPVIQSLVHHLRNLLPGIGGLELEAGAAHFSAHPEAAESRPHLRPSAPDHSRSRFPSSLPSLTSAPIASRYASGCGGKCPAAAEGRSGAGGRGAGTTG